MIPSPFQIVLVEPEIPPNTGNIARLCGATGTVLNLVGKLGFSIDDRQLKRAGLDYWHAVTVRLWPDLNTLQAANPSARMVCTSAREGMVHTNFSYTPGDLLVFGKETSGLSREVLDAHAESCIRIPICGPVRSLNLSTATGIVLYEALRQTGFLDE